MEKRKGDSVLRNILLTAAAAILLFCLALAVPSGTVMDTGNEGGNPDDDAYEEYDEDYGDYEPDDYEPDEDL